MTDNLSKAEQIIERFGGIRPMAKAMGIAVTTVQGWKKRQSIPSARKADVLAAAQLHNIDLSGLVASTSGEVSAPATKTFKENVKAAEAEETPAVQARHEKALADAVETERREETVTTPRTPTSAELMKQIKDAQNKAVKESLWATGGMIVVLSFVIGFFLWPAKQNLDEQEQKLSALEGQVEAVEEKQSLFKKLVPEDMQAKIDDLKVQAENIQSTVTDLSQKTEEIMDTANTIIGPDGGPLSARLTRLEEQVDALDMPADIGGLIHRLEGLAASAEGQTQLAASFSELQDMVLNMQGRVDTLDEALAAKQQEEDSALGETLEGVSGDDLKAAALLLGFSQLRSSLRRDNQPFDEDLKVLERLIGDDNPELNAAIDKLAPKAAQGVLTPDGLSSEFKGLAGDIVFSSLSGEDVSLKEKATARLQGVLQVEKDGEALIGTDTQITVAQAQKMLDDGNVQGAVELLQTLDGEAAEAAQPFIDQAQMTLAAESLQGLLGKEVMSRLPDMGRALSSFDGLGTMSLPAGLPGDLEKAVDTLHDVSPLPGRVITDDKGSFSIIETKPFDPN